MSFNKEGLIFNSNDKKRSYKQFFIKETSHKESESGSSSKNSNLSLLTISKVALFIKATVATLVIGIHVILILVKVTNTIENAVKL